MQCVKKEEVVGNIPFCSISVCLVHKKIIQDSYIIFSNISNAINAYWENSILANLIYLKTIFLLANEPTHTTHHY